MAPAQQGSAGAMREATDDNGAAADRLGALLGERGKLSAAGRERGGRVHDDTRGQLPVNRHQLGPGPGRRHGRGQDAPGTSTSRSDSTR